ncbi:MAG: hypothetical protein IPH77_20870 [Ignavibacteria bacterium]|nr:hypothetical protein [Ignavibacteria bacterium]
MTNNGKVVTKLANNIYQNYGKYTLDWNGKNDIELMFPPEFISQNNCKRFRCIKSVC